WRRGVGRHQLADSRDLLWNALERGKDVQAVGPQVFGEQFTLETDDVGEAGGGLADEGRLIAPAAMGCRRWIRTIRLDEQAVQWHAPGHHAQVVGTLKGER